LTLDPALVNEEQLNSLKLLSHLPRFRFRSDDEDFEHIGNNQWIKHSAVKDVLDISPLQPRANVENTDLTFTAEEECDFAVINREDFFQNLERAVNEKRKAKVAFLMENPVFCNLRPKQVYAFSSQMKAAKFTYNQVVYRQGDPCKFCYFVHKGEFELKRSLPRNFLAELPEFNDPRTIVDLPRQQPLVIYTPRGLVGDEDMLGSQVYTGTLRCKSEQGKVYTMSKRDFLQLRSN
jgi:CRP-like cAMP-binding protein